MSRSDVYRQHGAECFRLAQSAKSIDDKTQYAKLASEWMKLATEAAKSEPPLTDGTAHEQPPNEIEN